MTKTRLEAFSDAVIAIIITIMVLELKVPHETTFDALVKLWPVFLSYTVIFLMIMKNCNTDNHALLALLRKRSQKGTLSVIMYTAAIGISFFRVMIGCI